MKLAREAAVFGGGVLGSARPDFGTPERSAFADKKLADSLLPGPFDRTQSLGNLTVLLDDPILQFQNKPLPLFEFPKRVLNSIPRRLHALDNFGRQFRSLSGMKRCIPDILQDGQLRDLLAEFLATFGQTAFPTV